MSENAREGESRALTPRTGKVWGQGLLGSAVWKRFNLSRDMILVENGGQGRY